MDDAQFFDAVRAVNLAAPKEKRVRMVLGDAPILWRKIQAKEQWRAFTGRAREQALAWQLNEVLDKQQRALVIGARSHLLRTDDETASAGALVDKADPGQVFGVIPESRFGVRDMRGCATWIY